MIAMVVFAENCIGPTSNITVELGFCAHGLNRKLHVGELMHSFGPFREWQRHVDASAEHYPDLLCARQPTANWGDHLYRISRPSTMSAAKALVTIEDCDAAPAILSGAKEP